MSSSTSTAPPPSSSSTLTKKRTRRNTNGTTGSQGGYMLRSHAKRRSCTTTPLSSNLPRDDDKNKNECAQPPPRPMATRSRTKLLHHRNNHTPTTHTPPVHVTPRTTTTTSPPLTALLRPSRHPPPQQQQRSFYTDPALGTTVDAPLPPGVVPLRNRPVHRQYPSPKRRQPRHPAQDDDGDDYLTTYGVDYLHYLQQKQSSSSSPVESRRFRPPPVITTTTTTHMESPPRTNSDDASEGHEEGSSSLTTCATTTTPPCRIVTTRATCESDLTHSAIDTTATTTTPLTHSSLVPSPPPAVESSLPHQPWLTPRMRRKLVLWMAEVGEEFKLSEATYHLSVTLVDEMLSKNPFPIRREQFQAVGCVCIWIASKLEDVKPPSRSQLCYISDFSVSDGQLLRMEQHICTLLEFRLQRVTPFHLLPLFLRACSITADPYDPTDETIASLVQYFLELSRTSYRLTQERPDLVAAACVYLARSTLLINPDQPREDWYWTKTLEHYTGYKTNDMVDVIIIIYILRMVSADPPLAGVGGCPLYQKYATREHHYASHNIPPRLEHLCLPISGIDYDKYMEPLQNEQDYFVHLPSLFM